jgi:hypothetical protein
MCGSITRGLLGASITILINFRLQVEDPNGDDLKNLKIIRLSRISERDGNATVSGVIEWEQETGRRAKAWAEHFIGRFRNDSNGNVAYDCLVGSPRRSRVLIKR